MTSQTANVIGLVLGIVGVVLIFIWGPPQPNLHTGISLGIEDATPIDDTGKTVADHNREVEALRRRHIILSRLGLALIGLGFAFQLAATWLPSSPTRRAAALKEAPR